MLPYKSILNVDRAVSVPLYLQIATELIKNISAGIIPPSTRLPGTRTMGTFFNVNRRTVALAYEELEAQGWVEINPNKGTYVKSIYQPLEQIIKKDIKRKPHSKTNFQFREIGDSPQKAESSAAIPIKYVLDDGYPDVRIAPLDELYRELRNIGKRTSNYKLHSYTQQHQGDIFLRQQLLDYLSATRALPSSLENVVITRGSTMGFYIIFRSLLLEKDYVAVAAIGFNEVYRIIHHIGGRLLHIPIDANGIQVDYLEDQLNKGHFIKAIYLVPHHQYPTTVTLSAGRRKKLLWLAEQFQFAIIEDDYAYDYHYSSSPILPLASMDTSGNVIYVGSLSKTLAPSLRLGYVVAPSIFAQRIVQEISCIDSIGNTALEHAIGRLFEDGTMKRHLRKSLKLYKARRDLFCNLLERKLIKYLDFVVPEGGLAVWVQLKSGIKIMRLADHAMAQGLRMNDGSNFNSEMENRNGLRIGFAAMNIEESNELISQLEKVFRTYELRE